MRTSAIRGRRAGILAIGFLVVLSAHCLVRTSCALGAPVPTSSAQATIEFSPTLRRALRRDRVRVRPVSPATIEGLDATFPGQGSLDPATGQAVVAYEGGLLFRRADRVIQIGGLQLDTATGTLDGDLGYGQMAIAETAFVSTPEGFGARSIAGSLALTTAASRALRNQLHLPARARRRPGPPRRRRRRRRRRIRKATLVPALRPGQSLGNLTAWTQPGSVGIVAGGTMTFSLDPGLVGKLADLDIGISADDLAGEPSPDTFSLAVGSGELALPGDAVTVVAGGTLGLTQNLLSRSGSAVRSTLTLAGPSLGLPDGTFEAELSGFSSVHDPLNVGSPGRIEIGTTTVAPGELAVDPVARTVALPRNVTVMLSSIGAEVLDGFRRLFESTREEARPQDEIRAGEPLGTVSFSAQAE